MATVTGLTATRMLAIEAASVVSGSIVGDDLILEQFGGGTINAGDVRGPQGPTGATGGAVPAGTFIFGGWAAEPTGYLFMDGVTRVGGAAAYPTLAALFPSWVAGGDLIPPNANGAVPMVGAVPGVVSGSMTHTLTSVNQLPAHTHNGPSHTHTGPSHTHAGPAHAHTASSASGGAHTHTIAGTTGSSGSHQHQINGFNLDGSGATGNTKIILSDDGYNYYGDSAYVTAAGTHTHNFSATADSGGSHSHTITVDSYAGGTTGAGGTGATSADGTGATSSVGASATIDHTPKNITVKMAVKT